MKEEGLAPKRKTYKLINVEMKPPNYFSANLASLLQKSLVSMHSNCLP